MLLEVLPALRAEESMLERTRIGMGSGTMSEDNQKEVLDAWKEDLGLIEAPKSKRATGAAMMQFAQSVSKVKVVRG